MTETDVRMILTAMSESLETLQLITTKLNNDLSLVATRVGRIEKQWGLK